MTVDSIPTELGTADPRASAPWPEAMSRPTRRTPRVVGLLFALFVALLGVISLTATAAPVNAAYPHSLRAVLGEGCGGG